MPISAAAQQAYALEIRRAYQEAERIILAKMARRIAAGLASWDEHWLAQKLTEIVAFRGEVTAEIVRLRRLNPKIAEAVETAYSNGAYEAVQDLKRAKLADFTEEVIATRGVAVQTLVGKLVNALESTHFQILRTAQDAYRDVVAEASTQATIGVMTRRQAAQRVLDRFADIGIRGFVDTAGRQWELASYAEMATRTTTGQAAVEGHLRVLEANGKDVVIVHASMDACATCAPWNGQLVSLKGLTPGLPTLAEAMATGHLMGPNCGCSLSLYSEGVTRAPEPIDPAVRARMYADRQQQRYLERGVRRWKNREAVALDNQTRTRARTNVTIYQQRLRELTAQTGRRRDYGRESITRAR